MFDVDIVRFYVRIALNVLIIHSGFIIYYVLSLDPVGI